MAPVINQSGMGGKSDFSTEANLTTASQYDIVPKGAPSVRFVFAALDGVVASLEMILLSSLYYRHNAS